MYSRASAVPGNIVLCIVPVDAAHLTLNSNLQWIVPGPTFGSGFCMPTTITWNDVPLQSPINGNWPIEVQWASSDLDSFTPKSAPLSKWYDFVTSLSSTSQSSTTRPATPVQSGGSQPTSTGNNTTGSDSSGLSTGAKAGIGVGAAFAFFAALAFLVLFFMYRRKRKAGTNSTAEPDARTHELRSHELQERHQLGGNPIHEAAGHPKSRELDSSPRAELEGG
jgi:hypothetical protein